MKRLFTKEDIWVESNYIKKCSKSYIIRELQIKQKSDAITYVSEWPKLKTLTTPNADEDVHCIGAIGTPLFQWECHQIPAEDSSAVSYKTKHTLCI